MRNTTETEVGILHFLREKWNEYTRVFGSKDKFSEEELFVLSSDENPHEGYRSYSTIGLSSFVHRSGDTKVRLELAGCALEGVENYDNLLASCAYYSISNESCISYGFIIKNIMYDHNLSRSLEHMTFVSPFLWDGMRCRLSDEFTCHWLLALPISSGEANFLIENGIDALERRFEDMNVDVLDLERESIF